MSHPTGTIDMKLSIGLSRSLALALCDISAIDNGLG